MKSKIIIFEANKNDGIMSKNQKFYDKTLSEEERQEVFHQRRLELGKKLGIDGNHIFKANQKGQYEVEYENGKYIILKKEHMTKEDYYEEFLPADILIISKEYPNIAVGNPAADCPILICEDRKKGYTALSHCGATYINRYLPKDTIKALINACQSNPEEIYAYISSCIKKESYCYDQYPKWAKEEFWKEFISVKEKDYYIDLVGAIRQQLQEEGITHIEESPINTATDSNYYSHSEALKGKQKKLGQNFIGFYYK